MINFALGFIAGASCAVLFPPVFKYVAAKLAALKAKLSPEE
jgi:hypothetical protein